MSDIEEARRALLAEVRDKRKESQYLSDAADAAIVDSVCMLAEAVLLGQIKD